MPVTLTVPQLQLACSKRNPSPTLPNPFASLSSLMVLSRREPGRLEIAFVTNQNSHRGPNRRVPPGPLAPRAHMQAAATN